jgi:autotransporter-associated beta strand protein
VKLASAQTLGASRIIHSLNIQDTTGRTLNLMPQTAADLRRLTINSGGILSTRQNHVLTGGFITAGTYAGSRSPYELIFHLPTNILTVQSVIEDNGGQAVSVTKSGNSVLVLNPQIVLSSSLNQNTRTVTLASGHLTSQLAIGTAVTGTGIPDGTVISAIISSTQVELSNEPTRTITTNLTYARDNTYTGRTFVNEGTLQLTRESDLGANPVAFNAEQLTVNGGIVRAAGNMVIDDVNRGITIGQADGLFRVANNSALVIGSGSVIDGSSGKLMFAADVNNRGVMIVHGNHDLTGGVETSGAQTASYTATLASSFSSGGIQISVPSTLGLSVGAEVSGAGIPAGATVARILDENTIEMSAPATGDGSGQNLTFSGFNVLRLTGDNTIGFMRLIGSAVSLEGSNVLTDNILVAAGDLYLGGTNEFNGTLVINAGTVRMDSPTGVVSANGWNLETNGGLFDLNDHSTVVTRLTGAGGVTNDGSGTGILTVDASTSHQFTGMITDGVNGGKVSLIKDGPGILTLTSNVHSYSGATIINEGGILVRQLSFGGAPGGLGSASSAAGNLVMNGGFLRFSDNAPVFTDRSFTLGVGADAGGIYADGTVTGAVVRMGFSGASPAIEFTGSGSRSLTLGGFNRGDNRFELLLGDGPDGTTSLRKTGNGTWVISGANTYKGETRVEAGILAATVNDAFGGPGAAGVVIAGGTNGSQSLGNTNATVDLRNVDYSTPLAIYLAGGTLATTTGNSSWAGPVFATGNSLLSIGDGASLTLKGTVGGGNAITQIGGGTLVLSGQADVTTRNSVPTSGPHHTVQAGTLRLDYNANNNSKLADTGVLVLGGGRLGGAVQLTGGSHVEIVSSTQVNAGSNQIERLTGNSMLRLNGISRQAGGTVSFGSEDIASTDLDNVAGILGAWATLGTDDWAFKSTFSEAGANTGVTTGADKLIRRFTDYNNSISVNDWVLSSTSGNMNVTGDNIQTNSLANTLRFHTPDPDLTRRVTLHGTNMLNSGGILITPGMSSSDVLIDGTGSLTTGRQFNLNLINDLVIIQNNTSAHAEIAAVIANASADRSNRAGITSSASTAVSGIANTADLYLNMLVSGPGIVPNTRVTGISANGITLSIAAGAEGGAGTLTFSQDRAATTLAGNTTVVLSDVSGLFAGMVVSGPGILPDTRIQSVSGLNIVLNTAPGAGAGAGTLAFITPTGLDKSGPGDLILSGLSSYTGVTSVNQGTLTIGQLAIQGFAGNRDLVSNLPSIGRSVAVASTNGLTLGQLVVGAEVPTGVTIAVINSPTTFTLSNGALVTAAANLTYGNNIPLKTSVVANVAINSAVVNLPAGQDTKGLTPGQAVTGTGIPAGAVVLNILSDTQFTLGQAGVPFNATASSSNVTLTFAGGSIFTGSLVSNTTSGTTITVASTLGMVVGQPVSGNNIPAGSVIARILDANNLEISNPVTGTGQANRTFGVTNTIGDTLQAGLTIGSSSVGVPFHRASQCWAVSFRSGSARGDYSRRHLRGESGYIVSGGGCHRHAGACFR